MTRLISCSHTIDQIKDRSKTVTRRKGWRFLKPGDRLVVVEKAMGLKKGEHPVRLAEVEVVSIRRGRLDDIHYDINDPAREGFPEMSTTDFIEFFCRTFGGTFAQEVTRIEWRYVDDL